jgi:HAD superfamily hydrolase (TIGR01509 family)
MRTVLWDLDGTIADTEALHYEAWNAAASEFSFTYTYAQFKAGFGQRNAEVLSELLGIDPKDQRVDEISAAKEALFRALLRKHGLQPLPGVVTWLGRLAAAGVQQVVSSSGPMANIAATVDVIGLGDYFVCLMSGARLARGKPDPAIFLNSAAAVGAQPAECIVVEDSVHGIGGARRGGMGSIAVGKLAGSVELDELLANMHGPACVPVGNLERLTWEQCERLWDPE